MQFPINMQCPRSNKIPLFVLNIAKQGTKVNPVGAEIKLFTVFWGHPVVHMGHIFSGNL